MRITECILTKNSCYQAGEKIKVKGLMLHSVGCSQPSAQVFVKNWNNPTIQACVHGFIDANSGNVYQTLPWEHRGWHAGGKANNTHIGVEMCEPDCITYSKGANFTCTDINRAKVMVERTYKSAVELFAHLCAKYALNPLEKGVIIAHNEGFTLGLASNHADPEHLWKGLKMPYTMDGFRQDVSKAMNKPLYRVQVGAFANKTNAEKLLNKLKKLGFEAFITKED